MTEHSPEPWTVDLDSVFDRRGQPIFGGDCQDEFQMMDELDMKRIVACVNACRGIPTEALDDGVVRAFVFGTLLNVDREDCKVQNQGITLPAPAGIVQHIEDAAKALKKHGGAWEQNT